MASKQVIYVFQGFVVDGVLYPPDKPPQEIIEGIDRAVRDVLFPGIKDRLIDMSLAEEKNRR